jgi:glycine oxidase
MSTGAVDVVVLGRGIAGAVLTETLRRAGHSVHVFDQKQEGNASMAAGGVVNPLVLRRDIPSWRAAEFLPIAGALYTSWQERLGVACWHHLPLVKLFPTAKEGEQWQRAMATPASALFAIQQPEPEVDAGPFQAPYGYGTVRGSAWLDVPALLAAQRDELLAEGALSERSVGEADIRVGPDGVRVGTVEARWLVRCQGPFASARGMVPVKGETLVVRIPGLMLTRMVHRGVFILPLGEDRYRVGATFQWNEVFSGPSEAGRTWLLERLARMVDAPVELLSHTAGVRPAARDRRPLLGITGPGEALFNGLGSRGVLLAPWCAEQLVAHLFIGTPLDPEVRWDRALPDAADARAVE